MVLLLVLLVREKLRRKKQTVSVIVCVYVGGQVTVTCCDTTNCAQPI
jgi:hypothetical protein